MDFIFFFFLKKEEWFNLTQNIAPLAPGGWQLFKRPKPKTSLLEKVGEKKQINSPVKLPPNK